MDVTFSEPRYFWVGVIFPVLIGLFLRNGGQRRKLLRQLVAVRLEGRLAGSLSVAKRVGRFVCMLTGLGLVVVALAGAGGGGDSGSGGGAGVYAVERGAVRLSIYDL